MANIIMPDKFQTPILEWAKTGKGSVFIDAGPGSGKSTTIELVVEEISVSQKILILAFNSHIKEQMRERMKRFFNVEVMTFNGLGWRLIYNEFGKTNLAKWKTANILQKMVSKEKFLKLKKPIEAMVNLLRSLNETDTSRAMEHAAFYGIELGEIKPSDDFDNVLANVFKTSIETVDYMDFTDQVYQPIYRNLSIPEYDWILVDESQDASPLNIEMITRLQQAKFGRVMTVGDPQQSCYLFRGAHPKAMEVLQKNLNATLMPLYMCYRLPNLHIEYAREIAPKMEAPVPNPRGDGILELDVKTSQFVKDVMPGDFVLCRCVAPLVKRCMQQLRMGKRAFVKGRDIADSLIELIERIHGNPMMLQEQCFDWSNGKKPSEKDLPGFILKLREYGHSRVKSLVAQGLDTEAGAIEDRVQTLEYLAQDAEYVIELIVKAEGIMTDEDEKNAIIFMTGHKAKGLEGERIWQIRPDLVPHPRAKSEVQIQQEWNLELVMRTRSTREYRTVLKERGEK